MAFRINIERSFEWPRRLARPLDVDGAFRRASCLAAARVCELRRGYDPGGDYIAIAAQGASLTSLDSHRAMFGCFLWDGGTEEANYTAASDSYEIWATPGRDVFRSVPSRVGKVVSVAGLSPDERREALAAAGLPSDCLASWFPYRVWWRAFNRAVYDLTEDIEYDGSLWLYRDWPALSLRYGYRVLPLCLSRTPAGDAALGPDALCVDWTPTDEAASLEVVPGGVHWLMTPGDVDFWTGWFGYDQRDSPHGGLRELWTQFAHEVGFLSFAQGASMPASPRFRDGYASWWHGRTEPRFWRGEYGRLLQLGSYWMGLDTSWRDEFPYHGLASQVAVLDYLETCNVGFAVWSADDEGLVSISHWARSLHKSMVSEVVLDEAPSEGAPVTVTPGTWTTETSESTTESDRFPEASRSCTVNGGVSAEASVTAYIDWTVFNLIKYAPGGAAQWSADGDSANILEEYARQGPAVLANRLNQMWSGADARYVVRFLFGSSYMGVWPSNNILPDRTPWPLYYLGELTPREGSFPFAGQDPLGQVGGAARVYVFIKTSNRSAILKVAGGPDDPEEYDILEAELDALGCPSYDDPDDLPGPGPDPAYAEVHPLVNPFSVEQTDERINLWGTFLVPMFIVKFDGRKVFPPDGDIPPGAAYREFGDVTIGDVTASPYAPYTDPNDYGEVECSSQTRVEALRAIRFLKYPRNVIYPR